MRKVTLENGDVYEIKDESFEDDYGSYVSNHAVYKNGERVSPRYYALHSWDAENYIPRKTETCKCCGHSKVLPIKWDEE